MYNTSLGARGIPNKSDSEQKYRNFRFSSPKTATDMGVPSLESHELAGFYETLTAGFGVLPEIRSKKHPDRRIPYRDERGMSRGSKPVCIGDLRMGPKSRLHTGLCFLTWSLTAHLQNNNLFRNKGM